MKLVLTLFVCLMIISGCGLEEKPRSNADAYRLVTDMGALDVIHFVVDANCDYDFFFEYQPMRRGGYYAYGYHDNNPSLVIIPNHPNQDAKAVEWPLLYSVEDALTLLNTFNDDDYDVHTMYASVRLELTSSVLNDYHSAHYDIPFFIVMHLHDTHYVAFQQNQNLVIYHADDGFIIGQ